MRAESNNDGTGSGGLKVLLVEDDAITAFDVETILRDFGCARVFVACSVEKALEVLRTERPDAALLDLHIQDGRVTPVAQVLAATGVPFAVVTGYEVDEVRKEPLLRGALYLGKPYGRSDICHLLTQLTAMSHAA
jgi:two-component system, response regulator PdtaR